MTNQFKKNKPSVLINFPKYQQSILRFVVLAMYVLYNTNWPDPVLALYKPCMLNLARVGHLCIKIIKNPFHKGV